MPPFSTACAGALGYVLKDVSGQELAQAVRTIAGGGALLDPAVARRVMGAFARLVPPSGVAAAELIEPLSERERAVLRLLGDGLTNGEIGRQLHLSEGTVKNYVTSVLQKIGARTGHRRRCVGASWV